MVTTTRIQWCGWRASAAAFRLSACPRYQKHRPASTIRQVTIFTTSMDRLERGGANWWRAGLRRTATRLWKKIECCSPAIKAVGRLAVPPSPARPSLQSDRTERREGNIGDAANAPAWLHVVDQQRTTSRRTAPVPSRSNVGTDIW